MVEAPISKMYKACRLKAVAIIVVVAVATMLSVFTIKSDYRAIAETTGRVIVHVFDPAGEYSSLGGWFWVKGGSGFSEPISKEAASDEPFMKDNGNRARTFTVSFSATQIAQLKGGTPMGLLICTPTKTGSSDFWQVYSKETADIFVSLTDAFIDNVAHVYYLRKDNVAYTDIEEAKQALEKITNVRFSRKTETSTTVTFDATSPIKPTMQATLIEDTQELETVNVKVGDSEFSGVATFTKLTSANFNFGREYYLKVEGINNATEVSKAAFMDDRDFIKLFECEDTQRQVLGVTATRVNAKFAVWAPFASEVRVKLYSAGTAGDILVSKTMYKRMASVNWGGIWEVELDGDYIGKYYTYVVTNGGADVETIDPYAKACGVNGARGMIVDLNATNPSGWQNDKRLYATNPTAADVPIVWELQVNDFSSSSDSGMRYKGKYLAFTEENTHVPGAPNLKTGVAYLKDLGITYVHLNPVYDFATVDESNMSGADDAKDTFNWGYDPQNYNIPDGAYSTDPNNGAVRIKEFKQMVMALHKAGIGVIMDVVYNHTYSTSGQALNDAVPYYYYRTDENGAFTDGSGCGNETASERNMVRKYIIDSLVYWAEEYHIDGFRFDLMGLHDLITIEKARAALDALDGGNGKKILMYGEPWAADGDYIAPSFKARIAASGESRNSLIKVTPPNTLPDRVAVFNDIGRDGLRGSNDPGTGWAQGNTEKAGDAAALMNGTAKALGLGSRNVAYAAVHDNYTLWDQMIGKKAGMETPLFYEEAMSFAVKRCMLASAAYLMSPGIAFMLAGEEIGRTKYGNHNSYNSPSKLNQIVWSRQAEFAGLYDHYKKLIQARKANVELFSYERSTQAGSTGSWFSATGLVIGGTRGVLSVKLDAAETSTGNYVKINGTDIVSF